MISLITILIFIFGVYLLLKDITKGFEYVLICSIMIPKEVSFQIGFAIPLVFALIITLEVVFLADLYLNKTRKENVLIKPIGIYFGLLLIGSIFAAKQSIFSQVYQLIVSFSTEFLLLIIAYNIYDSKEKIDRFVKILTISFLIMCIYGLYTYIIKSNPYYIFISKHFTLTNEHFEKGLTLSRGQLEGRIQSFMKHTITYSGYLMLFTIFITNYYRKSNFQLYYLILPLLLINIVLTGTKSAIIPLVIYLVFLIFTENETQNKVKLLFSVLVISVLIVNYSNTAQEIILSSIFFWDTDTMEMLGTNTGSTFEFKINQFHALFQFLENKTIVFGNGIGFISNYYINYGFHPVLKGFESLFIKILVESGLFGLIPWSILYYSLYKLLLNKKSKNKNTLFQITPETFLVIGQLLFALMTGPMQTQMFLFVLVAISYKNSRLSNELLTKRFKVKCLKITES